MRRLLIIIASLVTVGAGVTAVTAAVSASASVSAKSQAVSPKTHYAQTAAIVQDDSKLASDVLAARLATRRYLFDLPAAQAAGYHIITHMIPYMGWHFLNMAVSGFEVRRPPILVYEHGPLGWQLGALEWVFTSMPSTPPLPDAQYGVFGAACHYIDGTFVFQTDKSKCAAKSPLTGAAFNFWHPRLITLHFWVWYPNPAGIYSGTNPLAAPFNG